MSRRRQLAKARAEKNGGTGGDSAALPTSSPSPAPSGGVAPSTPAPAARLASTPAALLPLEDWPLSPPPTAPQGAPGLSPVVDGSGFALGEQPHVSEDQVRWLTHRTGAAGDEDAHAASGITPEIVAFWRHDPAFSDLEAQLLANKREGFRALGTQLLPKALRAIDEMLDSDNPKAREKGLTLLLRTQALLIDRVQHDDPAALAQLVLQLRTPQPYEPITPQNR